MKEAAGEANMTVITIILIGVIAAIAIPMVNSAMKNAEMKAACNAAGGYMNGATCYNGNGSAMSCAADATGAMVCQ